MNRRLHQNASGANRWLETECLGPATLACPRFATAPARSARPGWHRQGLCWLRHLGRESRVASPLLLRPNNPPCPGKCLYAGAQPGLSGGSGARGAETGGVAVAAVANRGLHDDRAEFGGRAQKSQRLSPLARMLDVSCSLLQRAFSGRVPERLDDRQRAANFLVAVVLFHDVRGELGLRDEGAEVVSDQAADSELTLLA